MVKKWWFRMTWSFQQNKYHKTVNVSHGWTSHIGERSIGLEILHCWTSCMDEVNILHRWSRWTRGIGKRSLEEVQMSSVNLLQNPFSTIPYVQLHPGWQLWLCVSGCGSGCGCDCVAVAMAVQLCGCGCGCVAVCLCGCAAVAVWMWLWLCGFDCVAA